MSNERGFFTIVGLCLLMAVAISIRGVQEFEGNYSVGVTNALTEFELQNAADSALVEAAEKISLNVVILPYYEYGVNQTLQREIPVNTPVVSNRLKNFSIKVFGQRAPVARYWRSYSSESQYTDKSLKDEENRDWAKRSTILISVASCDSNFIGEKIYRRSLAYVVDGDTTIYFLNDLMYEFKHGW